MDQPSKMKYYIHLVEFSYNNGHHASLKMSPFEELYGRKCYTLVSWDNLAERTVVGPELLKEMENHMPKINKSLNASQDRHKSCVDRNRVSKDFKVGEHVFLKVKENISSLRLGSCPKFTTIYCGSFKILERIGPVVYMLAFPASMRVHNVFHVPLLNKYVSEPNHIID
jgi:hypothetical protein